MSVTPRLALPLLAAAQAQKHVTHNEALIDLDGLVHLAVKDRDLAAAPGGPVEGDAYIVAASPTGLWAGRSGQVARFQDGVWTFSIPSDGWLCWVDDEEALVVFNGGSWISPRAFQNLALLGVSSTADATNRLSVSSPASLFTHAGAGHQLKVNKNAAADVVGVVFQTGFSGRAEMGLSGDDKFRIKVSANGTTWLDAQSIDPATGNIGIGTSSPATKLQVNGPVRIGNYPKASLPSATTSGAGAMIYVLDDIGGAVPAFSDGTAWRRVTDRAVVA
jgi:hypothetical protein